MCCCCSSSLFPSLSSLGSDKVPHFLTQVMENIQNLTKLQELWLGQNRIRSVDLCGLKCIKKISLQSNRLTSMRGFEVFLLIYFLFISFSNLIVVLLDPCDKIHVKKICYHPPIT